MSPTPLTGKGSARAVGKEPLPSIGNSLLQLFQTKPQQFSGVPVQRNDVGIIVVRFQEERPQRHTFQCIGVKFRSEREETAVPQQLFRQLGLPPKAMNNDRRQVLDLRKRLEQLAPSLHTMHDHRFPDTGRHAKLEFEELLLEAEISIAHLVETDFANSHNLFLEQQLGHSRQFGTALAPHTPRMVSDTVKSSTVGPQ